MIDIQSMFTSELKIRGKLREEIDNIGIAVREQISKIVSLLEERNHDILSSCIQELMEYNAQLIQLEAHIKLSDRADDRHVLVALDNIIKLVRYTRDDVKIIAQLTMNAANNAT